MTILKKIKKLTGLTFTDENSIDWDVISKSPLTEDSIREFQDKVDWDIISARQKLSEDFIREFKNKVNWCCISVYQKLSEDFIREFQDKVNWSCISIYQKLSEDFIREFKDKVDWDCISKYQSLSENFIRKFKNRVDWGWISIYQKLSKDFIREFKDTVAWDWISKYQSLSEDFIREFKDKVDWAYISKYQKLSTDFISEFGDCLYKDLLTDNWIYRSPEEKKQAVIETGKYECHEDYFIAYKAIRSDRYSKYNFQYQYLPGGEYESWCDCSDSENSFGLSTGTMKFCENYAGEKDIIIKVQVRYEDVGKIVHDGEKIRCFKIKILD